LVAAKHGTSKVHDASKCSKHKIHVVTPEWLIESNYKWIKCKDELPIIEYQTHVYFQTII
jgi:hypothetical protein